jgi:hypothetical protein
MNMKSHSSQNTNDNVPLIARAFYVHRPRMCLEEMTTPGLTDARAGGVIQLSGPISRLHL